MKEKYIKTIQLLTILTAVTTSFIGIFSKKEGFPASVFSIYGREIILYGKGAYGYMSVMRAGTYIATGIVMLGLSCIIFLLLICTNLRVVTKWLHSVILLFIFYYSCSLVFGTPLSRMFIPYVILFSLSGASLFLSIKESISLKLDLTIQKNTYKVTATFLILASLFPSFG